MKFTNSRKTSFLAAIPECSLDSPEDRITLKCKFNFAYFEKQAAGQSFDEWSPDKLHKFFGKLKDYSSESLPYWMGQRAGKAGKVLSIYGAFPKNTDFVPPKHVPHQVQWGRFRLDWASRLVGFVVPNSYQDKAHASTGARFDCNTFYVVFLDAEHRFYKGNEGK